MFFFFCCFSCFFFFFFSSRRRHTRCGRDWSSDVCSSDLDPPRCVGAVTLPIAAQGGPQIELADKLEHVLLRPDVTPSEVDDACASAVESGLAAVTVWPADVPREAAELARQLQALCRIAHAEGVHVRAVLQAPLALAAHTAAPQQAPLAPAVGGGGGLAWMRVGAPEASPSATELAEAGRLAVEAGADLLQTGFGVWGRATLEQVRAVRRALPSRHAAIGVIAGGAEDANAARHLLERAGADRVAVLDPAAVLQGVAAA